MSEEKKRAVETEKQDNKEQETGQSISETWAEDARIDLEDWIEEQGIYIRQ